jgi:hypothetical protein
MLNKVFASERIELKYGESISNIMTLLRLMKNCKLFDVSWGNMLTFVLYFGINGDAGLDDTITYTEELTDHYLSTCVEAINLMMKLCYEESWVCYSHFRKLILTLLHRIQSQ